MKIKALIFDIDGVLIDFVGLHRDTFVSAFNTIVGDKILTYEFHDEVLDSNTTRAKLGILRDVFPSYSWDDDKVYCLKQKNTLEFIRQYDTNNRIKHVLEHFKEKGYLIGCYTNSNRTVMNLVLTKLGIIDILDCKLSNQDVRYNKPHPWGYFKVMHELNVEVYHTMIFEDSEIGLKAARETGAYVTTVRDSSDITIDFIQDAISN